MPKKIGCIDISINTEEKGKLEKKDSLQRSRGDFLRLSVNHEHES